ncbi:MAG: S41 family peptidase [Thermoanaerobaculia bacterium]
MKPRTLTVCAIALCVAVAGANLTTAQTRLLRFPDIHGDKVVFTYGGDLWLASDSGGTAWRLTAHPGQELFAKFSPDGQWIAFTGQYDGDEQVYVVPTAGGAPRQLTFYPAQGPLPQRWGYDNQVYDWSPDGSAVLFRSGRYGHGLTNTRLFLAPVAGGLAKPLPMPESGAGALSPDGTRVVYSPLVRDFRAWKRYQGGWAQELYIFDLASNDLEQVTDHPRADRDPMWIGDKIYFTSDRDGRNNLFAYDTRTQVTEQLTEQDLWDIRWPGDDGENRIVYELDGELHVYDIRAGTSTQLTFDVPDDGLWKRPSRIGVEGLIEGYSLSPKGERALFVARGDVFTAPIEKGPTRNLTRSSGAHDKWARWSPDGSKIAFISDRTGEEEIFLIDQDGTGEPEQLTDNGAAMRYAVTWSPDGERIAFSDKHGKLYVVDVSGKDIVEIADDPEGLIFDHSWSPNGGHLAFSMGIVNDWNVGGTFSSIYIWSVADGQTRKITKDMFNDFEPVWDPSGDYLYYMSDRAYAPQISAIEWNFATDRETFIYALALREDVEHPFAPESDEVTVGKDDKDEKGEDEENGDEIEGHITIDFEDLGSRVARIPVEADNYTGLNAVEGNLVYVRTGPGYYGRSSDIKDSLQLFSFEKREASALAEDISGYALSHDGTKVLVGHEGSYKLYDVDPAGKDSAKTVSTSGLKIDRVPEEEWAQIFNEVWRRYRDFFYVDNMHGYDWEGLKVQYEPWLAHVAHRSDLNYLISEMISELGVGHAYIAGGDIEIPERPEAALPGAEFELDAASNRYRIAKILPGHNEEDGYRSPLTEIGIDINEGDYVLAIDGEELLGGTSPYEYLQHKADRTVELTVNSTPSMSGAREVSYKPITQERSLRYLAMQLDNQRRVDELSGGRLGYMHLPDMGASGIQEFIKWYYPQLRKEGLVIDARGNGGGNVSEMVVERLLRQPIGTRFSRNSDSPGTYPGRANLGHLICLLDEDSASDGDMFPHFFREAGLGLLVGKRSWGGVVGITNRGNLIDGGAVNVPEFGLNDMEGNWILEGIGVVPDIEVHNDAKSLLEGRDPQLERAVEELLAAIEADPRSLPERPEPPVKTP